MNLYNKVFNMHVVKELDDEYSQLYVGLHLIHEATSPQAFEAITERSLGVRRRDRNYATLDHIVPTRDQSRPFADAQAEDMAAALEKSCATYGIQYLAPTSPQHGIVHVIGPEMGLTQPGMTICCGDSHASTHGAFGAIAFGVGTTQVRDILATQCIVTKRLKVRRIVIDGQLRAGVSAKDVILHIIAQLGVNQGNGFAYEFAGEVVDAFSMEQRMTLCNMSIEGGARVSYCNPDLKTYEYLRGRPHAPNDTLFESSIAYWEAIRSDSDADYDDEVQISADDIYPRLTWGTSPDQNISIYDRIPVLEHSQGLETLEFMGWNGGETPLGKRIDVAFIGSCANSRISDISTVVDVVKTKGKAVAPHVRALVVPGSVAVLEQMHSMGYVEILERAGFEVHLPGCSMCVGMNSDRLLDNQVCASTSTRNFRGRQGSPNGKTLLMSPLMVAVAALTGEVTDPNSI